MNMLRQCAWCLRLIDQVGERLSAQPLPKLYEASHGMCGVCGALWMEQVLTQASSFYLEESEQGSESGPHNSSSPHYAVDFSISHREGNGVPMVCEGNGEYSSHIEYPFSDESELVAVDDTSDADLNKISPQRRL
jgi:hypothetical protein